MTLTWHNDNTTLQTILQGMGDQHIDAAIRRAEAKFQVGINVHEPKVPYQETITKSASAMHRHKKQTGGSGQFGEVHLKVAPLADKDFEFTWDVFGGAVSQSYSSSIQKGILSVMKEGVIAGYPVSGVTVSVFDGKEHPVDSKPVAFEVAGREAFKLAIRDANPVLREPIMLVKITVPEANMGDVMGDLNTRRARIQGMETEHGHSVVTATVPLAEMLRYTTTLRSITRVAAYSPWKSITRMWSLRTSPRLSSTLAPRNLKPGKKNNYLNCNQKAGRDSPSGFLFLTLVYLDLPKTLW